ncbi:PREDICTED: carbonic anhydrase 13-like [Hipposideros armiger]|uniref:Carbonic anhydrase 13-like n=1 Tax=Hipposideros armiger TaxID=186990 RepID=A0A8B7S3I0_HIPAR|nr:PREDICTED: carbonic anhydrase 13-like [Hipposideros armiger]
MSRLSWGYAEHNGPVHWNEFFPIADGDQQSPIEIKTKEVKYDSSLRPLRIKYDPSSAKIISNNGHSFSVDFDDTEDKSATLHMSLTFNYFIVAAVGICTELATFRSLLCTAEGEAAAFLLSNHRPPQPLKGRKPGVFGTPVKRRILSWVLVTNMLHIKLHVVHWNSDKYPSFVEAAHEPDGLAVLGVFLQVGEHNPQLQKITDILHSIKEKGKQTRFTNFDPLSLLPPSWDYWTYPGSLTVPPLLESVTWIVLKQPINISSQQVRHLL